MNIWNVLDSLLYSIELTQKIYRLQIKIYKVLFTKGENYFKENTNNDCDGLFINFGRLLKVEILKFCFAISLSLILYKSLVFGHQATFCLMFKCTQYEIQ